MLANERIARRLYDEVINQEDAAVIDEIFADNAVIHDPLTGTRHSAAAFRQLLGVFDTAFPHHRVVVDDIVAQGDMICILHTHTATHGGPFMGMPPTGKAITVNGIEMMRIQNGKIVEFWRKDDDVHMLVQLGMLPAPNAA